MARVLSRAILLFTFIALCPPAHPQAAAPGSGHRPGDRVHAYTDLGVGVWLDDDGTWELSGRRGLYVVEAAAPTRPGEIPPEALPRALVTDVFDGDTVTIRFLQAMPPLVESVERVRLLGVDTPELESQDPLEAARARAARAEVERLVLGREVAVAVERGLRDQFGRLLAYLYLPDGSLLNGELLDRGLASVYRQIPSYFHGYFLDLESAARSAGVGIWAGASVSDGVVIGTIFNEGRREYVELENRGRTAVDLAGYVLADDDGNRLELSSRILGSSLRILEPGSRLRIASGDPGEWWNSSIPILQASDRLIWNNGGDRAVLRDGEGRIVAEYSY